MGYCCYIINSNKENRKSLIINYFRFLLRDSVGICSLRSHIPDLRGPSLTKAAQRFALSLLFHTASALEQARLAGYKTTTPDFRQALLWS